MCGYADNDAEILSLEEAFRQYEKGYRDLERQINESLKNISDLLGFDLNDLNQGGE